MQLLLFEGCHYSRKPVVGRFPLSRPRNQAAMNDSFRLADQPGVIARRPELRISGTATFTVTPFKKLPF